MAIEKRKLSLTKRAVAEFDKKYKETPDKDYGRSFYDHFELGRIVDQVGISGLKTADRKESKLIVQQWFVLK